MIDVRAEVDLRDVQNGLRRLQLAGADLRPVFRSVRKALRDDQRQHAKERRGPDAPWRPLAQSTIEHRKARTGKQGRKRHKPIKVAPKPLGRLPNNFAIQIFPSKLVAKHRVKWSGVHNEARGATVARGARVPGRTFMYASKRFLGVVVRATVDHMLTAWKRNT